MSIFPEGFSETLCRARVIERRSAKLRKFYACCSAQLVAGETTLAVQARQTPSNKGFHVDTGFHGILFRKRWGG
jgi:hypothetical protein